MDQESISQESRIDLPNDQSADHGRTRTRKGENRLTWEFPLGVVRGQLDEPGPRFVDVEGEADKEACRLERGGLL
jgi:hypothetical protein